MYLPFGNYAGAVRAILRIYFMVLLVLVGLLGDRCLHCRTKLRLLQGQQVSLTDMTGWLRGGQLVKTTWQLRRLPGGFLGFFMIASAVLTLVADLAVSGLVQVADRPSRCMIEQGLNIDTTGTTEYPSMLGTAFYYASTSQITSMNNGGILGIYRITDNSANFAAQDIDVAGNWTCDNGSTPETYSHNLTNKELAADLRKKGFLYDVKVLDYRAYDVDDVDHVSYQLIFMSANAAGSWQPDHVVPSGSFDFKFAIDILDDASKEQKTMVSYHCYLTDSTPDLLLHQINALVNVSSIVQHWIGGIQGRLYSGTGSPRPVRDVPLVLTWMLNSMTMVAGTVGSVEWDIAGTEGCMLPYTHVPWPITLLVSITASLGLFVALYTIWLYSRIYRACRQFDQAKSAKMPGTAPRGVSSKEIKDNTPNGLVEWMQHAAYTRGTAEAQIKPHQLRMWLFSTTEHRGQRCLGVVDKDFLLTDQAVNNVAEGCSGTAMYQGEETDSRAAFLGLNHPSDEGGIPFETPSPSVAAAYDMKKSALRRNPGGQEYAMVSLRKIRE